MEEQRTDLTAFTERINALRQQISKVIVGQDENVDLLLTAVLANGHVLLEGVSMRSSVACSLRPT